jgi:hypothetical protein
MRNYEHFIVNGQILIPDHKSAKAGWGLNHPEYLEQNNSHFLREGTHLQDNSLIFQLTERADDGRIVAEKQQADGGYAEMGIPENKISWEE